MTSFTINGRFYGQAVTGVQRYGRETLSQIDRLLRERRQSAQLIIPTSATPLPAFDAITVRRISGASGHVWEQTLVPLRAGKPLLNLCNTAPLAIRRQVVCIHDANVFDAPASYSPAFRLLYRGLLPALARRSAAITSVSDFSAWRLGKCLGIPASSITVASNGHEHVFRWNASASALGERLVGTRPFVLLLGSRALHKNVGFILKQAQALDALGLDLVVAGGSAAIFAQTEAVVASNIHQLGFVSDDDLAWLYSHALCLAFPSRSEGFGIPLVEAMALGCPIVASNQSCIPEICGDAALLAGPDDAPAWLAHMRALADSPDLSVELRGRGRMRVKAFSWATCAQIYLDLIQTL